MSKSRLKKEGRIEEEATRVISLPSNLEESVSKAGLPD